MNAAPNRRNVDPSNPGLAAAQRPSQTLQQDTATVRRAPTTAAPLLLSSEQLFGGAVEVQIRHRGALYRLKQTALGKLILTK